METTRVDAKMLVVFFTFLVFRLGSGEAGARTSATSEYVWKPYPREMYPHFKRAYLNIASSDSKIAIFFHTLNLKITGGVYHPAEPDYTFTTDGYFDFYYKWTTQPPVETVDTTDVTDLSVDEWVDYSVLDVPVDKSVDERMDYPSMIDQSSDDSLFTATTEMSLEEWLYHNAVPDRVVEAPYTTESDPLGGYDQSFPNEIEDRLGLAFEELQEYLSDQKSPQTETVEKTPKPLAETVEKVVTGSSDDNPPLQAGSIRGIPGEHFPDYYEIPITSFTCADKKYIPGFYADLETGCQVFHVCWPHRRESFLCPVGTTFNQAILTCDYWYSSNCSLTPLFFDVNVRVPETETETSTAYTSVMIDDLIKGTRSKKAVPLHSTAPAPTTAKPVEDASEQPSTEATSQSDINWSRIIRFLPVKSKVVFYPESTGSKVTIKHSSVKPNHRESGEVKLDEKARFAAEIIKGILKAAADAKRSIPELESAAELLSPRKHKASKMPETDTDGKQTSLPIINERFVVEPLFIIHTTEEQKRKLGATNSSVVRKGPFPPVQPATVLKPKSS